VQRVALVDDRDMRSLVFARIVVLLACIISQLQIPAVVSIPPTDILNDHDAAGIARLEGNLGLPANSLSPADANLIQHEASAFLPEEGSSRSSAEEIGAFLALWKILVKIFTQLEDQQPACEDNTCSRDNPLEPYCQPLTGDCVECLADSTCQNPSFPLCYKNSCQQCLAGASSGPGSCEDNAGRPVCAEQGLNRGSCVECESNLQCSEPNRVCNQESNSCVQCVVDTDCYNLIGQPSCDPQLDPRCSLKCNGVGVCEQCGSDQDCASCPPYQVCAPLFQEEEAPATTARRRLLSHNAISRLSCRQCADANLDCSGTRNLCNFGECVQCIDAGDCPAVAPFCDSGSCSPCPDGTTSCQLRSPESLCSEDTDCDSTLVPYCSGFDGVSCVECTQDSDCLAPNPYCSSKQRCEACRSDDDCGTPRPFCNEGKCTACNSDSDCTNPLPVCSIEAGECVQCTAFSSSCPAAQPACELDGFTCVECTEDADCSGTLNPICNLEEFTCVPLCLQDEDCPASAPICDNGRCTEPLPPPAPLSCSPPGPPSNLRTENASESTVKICWDAPDSLPSECSVDRYIANVTLPFGGFYSESRRDNCLDLVGLPCGRDYLLQVQSQSFNSSTGGISPVYPFSTANCSCGFDLPDAPTNLTLGADVGGISFTISWSPAANATGYEYFCVDSGGGCDAPRVGAGGNASSDATNGTVTGLQPSTEYTCYVTAANTCGGTCAALGATGTTLCALEDYPDAPTNLTLGADVGGTSFTVSWSPAANATGYEYFCVDSGGGCDAPRVGAGGNASSEATNGTVTGLQPSTEYTCYVTAANTCGGTCAALGATGTTLCALEDYPDAPTNLTLGADVGGTSFTVSWSPAANATGYEYFCVDSGGGCDAPRVGAGGNASSDATNGTVTGLQPSTEYTCYVTAANTCGGTCAALGATGTTLCALEDYPDAPTNLTLGADVGGTSFTVSWSPAANATGYEYFCVDSGGGCDAPRVGAGGNASSDATNGTVTGLQPSTEYTCYVTAANTCGGTCAALGATGTTLCALEDYPDAPTNLTLGADVGGTSFTVSWSPAANATGYEYFCVDSGGGCDAPRVGAGGNASSDATNGTVTGLQPSTEYTCYVTAANTCGGTCAALGATGTTLCALEDYPDAPTNLTLGADVGGTSFTVSWSPAANATGYEYFCVDSGGGCDAPRVGAGGNASSEATNGTVTGLQPSTEYTCYVTAANTCGGTCAALGATGSTQCSLVPTPVISGVVNQYDGRLLVEWENVANVTQYSQFCVPVMNGSETCQSSPAGIPGSPTQLNDSSWVGDVTQLGNDVAYACYVQATDIFGCQSACSEGVVGTPTLPPPPPPPQDLPGTTRLLSPSNPNITSFVLLDGAVPGESLPEEEIPQQAFSDCVDLNEFPDLTGTASEARAAQYIFNIVSDDVDKFVFENSKDLQAVFLSGLFSNIEGNGYSNTWARIFSVDNRVNGAGVKVRVWFDSQGDCIAFTSYMYDRLSRNQGPGNVEAQYYNTTALGLMGISMVTNPQSRCHKWYVHSSFTCRCSSFRALPAE
jgi:hypothetical protein